MTGSIDREYQTTRDREHPTTITMNGDTEQLQKCDQQE